MRKKIEINSEIHFLYTFLYLDKLRNTLFRIDD